MKHLARLVSTAALLGLFLIFSGCASTTARGPRVEAMADFTVVESSTDKELTPAQLADLREAVINYLRGEGLTDDRMYYVKVSFPTENPGDEAQWAIVRVVNVPARTYTLLAAYPGPDDYYPYDFYRNGYYNPGYGSFSRYGYYDPFDYNYGGYSHRGPRRDHHPKPDKPDDKPAPPTPTRARWEHPRANHPDQPQHSAYPPRSGNPERWARERTENSEKKFTPSPARSGRDFSDGGSRSSPPPAYNPPAPSRSDPPASAREEQRPQPIEK